MTKEYSPRQESLLQQYDKLVKLLGKDISLKELNDHSNMYSAIRYNFGNYSNFKNDYEQWSGFEELDNNEDKIDIESIKQIRKLKDNLKYVKKTNSLLLNQITSQDNIYEYIIDKIPDINYVHVIKNVDLGAIERKEGTAVLHLSDLHYGEVVQFGDVVYDCAIAERRLSSIISQFCDIVKDYGSAVVFINGDMINGSIHDEFKNTNELLTIDAVLRLSKILAESLILIREHMTAEGLLDVVFTVGNHSRTLPGPVYYKNKVKENWEYLLGMLVQRELHETDIKVEVANTPSIIYNIEDLRFAVTHGDCFKSINNIKQGVAKFYEMNLSSVGGFDHILIGHFHTTSIQDGLGGKIFVNGSFKGYDEYSVNKLYSICKPEQTCLLVNGKNISNIIILSSEEE